MGSKTTRNFDHYNSRGDVIAQTDSTGSKTYEAEYAAFGARPQESGTMQDRQRANTKDEDPTGLINEGWRYYDPETGCFINRDYLGTAPVIPQGPDSPADRMPPGIDHVRGAIMMPKEKWMVDGKEVTPREYEDALEPGLPQVQTGPTKSAKNTGEEADMHTALATGEKDNPGQKNHWHTATAGFPNLYTYVNENPWTFFDPEGLADQYTWADALSGKPAPAVANSLDEDVGNMGKALVGQVVQAGLAVIPGGGEEKAISSELKAINPKIYTQLEKQLAKDGPGSIVKGLQTAEKTLQSHIDKLSSMEYKSQVERTIKNVTKQIQTIKTFMKNKNIPPPPKPSSDQ